MEIVLAGNSCEGIVFMFNGIGECLCDTLYEISCFFLIVQSCDERERVDEHTHCIADPDVASSV